tara:strand:+ start:2799 stop:2990 length:192 start_codon:yes stop_codon:yes gene_type:complete
MYGRSESSRSIIIYKQTFKKSLPEQREEEALEDARDILLGRRRRIGVTSNDTDGLREPTRREV